VSADTLVRVFKIRFV